MLVNTRRNSHATAQKAAAVGRQLDDIGSHRREQNDR